MNIANIPLDQMTPEKLAMLEKYGSKEIADQIRERINNTPTQISLKKFITCHKQMIELKSQVEKLAKVDDPVLILGESGTGKELLAQALHGDKNPDHFVAVNCGGIPENLIESELFGHVKGAFTGANTARDGLMKVAKDGTLFLDEIGDMAYPMQAKLLRAIQPNKFGKRYIKPVGGNEEQEIHCRIVAATHRDLESWIKIGKFREDLFYRLSTFTIKSLPLRSRLDDIPLLVRALDVDKNITDVEEFVRKIRPDKLTGNVRSLQQIVRRYAVLRLEPHE